MKSLGSLFNSLQLQTAYAHCDIPCGIYDPYPAQIAAHTVIRMTQSIGEAHAESDSSEDQKKLMHAIARYTRVKEDHAELVKREIRVIWGDYFKPEHVKKFPKLHELVFNIMKHASKAKQEVNIEEAKELLELVQQFAEIFWKTKGKEPVRVASAYPTGGEMVIYK
ncbi:MAG: superoxide dismutase, Ni [Candidatus Levybacteria bacterium RIFCSPHIGHO2_12_FULL_38_12]|nr:MAG: superoxide dismutase, Ni [Candidatus Levybacteria bacterium RIFCSPHIGHO2_01_FULL_38_12]OGH22043.1 MAG: superoxide dismutase, Ni [Candidatus Levybacteria bacterium RIFCSPHIGHO2_02_FULL_37_18]OGH23239.1 MAG: superoxide dismutase, Ni [Candidatus Levybacteria bacterium RIFCSPHIGHO2_12_FULL_38_12]OGH33736.1 MAG: superoxide dismutase, Ni [Candidatus Levybacteria bacterium RIFCSPLOWO2_01_FULL_37_20]OGH44642.1 MAG: superoxide dismutase, Ni [Candidatus Levybacteria bacterium RIFCSPLOWO2_02_FULL_